MTSGPINLFYLDPGLILSFAPLRLLLSDVLLPGLRPRQRTFFGYLSGYDVRQESLYDNDLSLERSPSLLAFWILPKTVPIDALAQSQILHIPMQEIRATIFSSKVRNDPANVHNLSQLIPSTVRCHHRPFIRRHLSFHF